MSGSAEGPMLPRALWTIVPGLDDDRDLARCAGSGKGSRA